MKVDDRFLFDCENGYYCSYVLLESCGFWYLMDEQHGNLWCSPNYAKTPIEAFGGESWHKRFRKLPKMEFDVHVFHDGDADFEVVYLTNGIIDVERELNDSPATRTQMLIRSNRFFKFDELNKISH